MRNKKGFYSPVAKNNNNFIREGVEKKLTNTRNKTIIGLFQAFENGSGSNKSFLRGSPVTEHCSATKHLKDTPRGKRKETTNQQTGLVRPLRVNLPV